MAEDNYELTTKCSEYKQLDKDLKVSELYSENAQEVTKATEAINERMHGP